MVDYVYKTEPFLHQDERFRLYRDRTIHAHLWEQRCGKSKVTIDTAAWQFNKGRINGLLIIAPNGVHLNWTRNEIPVHMPDYVGCRAMAYTSNQTVAAAKELNNLLTKPGFGLRALSMSVDAVNTVKGFETAQKFLNSYDCMLALDEGSVIKNLDAQRTDKVLKLSGAAKTRRLLNGTPVTQGPLDLFPQYSFLDNYSGEILDTTSYYVFRARYAIIETRGQFRKQIDDKINQIAGKLGTYAWGEAQVSENNQGMITAGFVPLDSGQAIEYTMKQAGRGMVYNMYWACGNARGVEKMFFKNGQMYTKVTGYQRLDELQKLIMPYSDRVLKQDCLGLPPKLFQKRYVELSTKQRKMYDDLKKKSLAECSGRTVSTVHALTKMLRLQQIVGGYFVPDQQLPVYTGGDEEEYYDKVCSVEALPIDEENVRIAALCEDLEMSPGKAIIWARFKAELRAIAAELRKKYGVHAVVEAHGDGNANIRQNNIYAFQNDPEVLYIVANPAAKGVSRGQNMCAAVAEYYYSNSFSLEDRLQSEDRPHSPGQTVALGVIDFIAPKTLDEKVVDSLRSKKNLADAITGDKFSEWI